MFEQLGLDGFSAKQAALLFGTILGLAFGFLAQRTRFCFRRALVGEDRRQAAGVWLTALAVALVGTQAAVASGVISFDAHRLLSAELSWLAIALGGMLFGAGMVLTRGCVSRLTVLSGSGNLRAALVLVVFAIVAHGTMKGPLAQLRVTLSEVSTDMGQFASLAALPGGPWAWVAALAAVALAFALRSGNRIGTLLMAAAIGALVPLGWVGTGFVLYDDFDPIALESLAFTSPFAESLFWSVASSAVAPGFGVGLVSGVLAGAAIAAVASREFHWTSFESPRQTGRYMAGAALMGVGGVLAGGCTVGAGLSGLPSLSLAALLAVVSMAAGGLMTQRVLSAWGREGQPAAEAQRRPVQPAA